MSGVMAVSKQEAWLSVSSIILLSLSPKRRQGVSAKKRERRPPLSLWELIAPLIALVGGLKSPSQRGQIAAFRSRVNRGIRCTNGHTERQTHVPFIPRWMGAVDTREPPIITLARGGAKLPISGEFLLPNQQKRNATTRHAYSLPRKV